MTDKKSNLPHLPKGWTCELVGEIAKNIPLTGKKLKQKEYKRNGKLPVVDQGQRFIGGYTDREELRVDAELPVIVFGDHTKIVKFVDFDFVAGADGIKVLKPIEAFYPKLFYYFLQAVKLPEKGYARHFQFLKKALIHLPPLPEQRRIVAKIEELFTKLDAGIPSLKNVETQLRRYRQAVLKHAFEGKLTEEWRGAYKGEIEHASTLLEHIKEERKKNTKEKYKQQPSVDTSNLPELPEGWLWTRLYDVAEIILGQSPPSSTYNENGNGVPFYQGKLEFGKIYPTPRKWCTAPKKIAEKGDVLISVRAPVGPTNICREKSCIGRGLAAIRGLGGIEPLFILYLMHAFENVISGKGTGTTFKAITGNQLKGFEIPLAPLSEQYKIVEEIEQRFSLADETEKVVEQSLKQAKRLRQSILKKTFEGKLVPQDPADEPAEKLLERVKRKAEENMKKSKGERRPKQVELLRYVK